MHAEFSFMEQDTVTGEFCKPLGQCLELRYVDISGCSSVADDGIIALHRGEIKNPNPSSMAEGEEMIIVGLR